SPAPSAADYVQNFNNCTASAACGCDAANGCTSACCGAAGDSGCSWCDLGEAWTLFPAENCYNLMAGGWTQIGYHTQGRNGAGVGYFNDYPNRVQLQQQWGWIEKAVDTGGAGFDWGFRMDYVYGTDGQDTQAFGSQPNQWDNPWDN